MNDQIRWRTPGWCVARECVEVGQDGAVLVRDTQDREGGVVRVMPGDWARFTGSIKDGTLKLENHALA